MATASSDTPRVIMEKAVPARRVETQPARTAETRPPSAPTNGRAGSGTHQPASASRIADIARKPPNPRNTAWPKSSIPPWPSSMLNDSANTMPMPMRHKSDKPKPPGTTWGRTSAARAASAQGATARNAVPDGGRASACAGASIRRTACP